MDEKLGCCRTQAGADTVGQACAVRLREPVLAGETPTTIGAVGDQNPVTRKDAEHRPKSFIFLGIRLVVTVVALPLICIPVVGAPLFFCVLLPLEGMDLLDGDHVFMRRSPHPVDIIASPLRTRFQILQAKLRWGER